MELSNTCNEMGQQIKTCKIMARQDTTISVPVSIKPKVSTGIANVYCCGESKIIPSMCVPKCKSYSASTECCFVLTQHICIEIPVEISADVQASTPSVECCIPPCPDHCCY